MLLRHVGNACPMGILAPEMALHFDLPVTEITRTFGALTFGNLIGAACATAVLAIWNLRSIFIATYAILGIALLLLGLSDQLLSVGVILAVVGFGCGVGLAAAAVLITLRFSASKKASMLILTDACFSIAGFLLSWVATTLIYFQFGWAVAYQLVGVICFAIVFASSISDFSNSEQGPGQDSLAIKTWPVNARWLSASLFLYTLGQYSFLLWLPTFASDVHYAGPILSGGLVAQFWFGMFAAQLFTSWWVFRIGTERLVTASATIFLGSLLLLFAPSAGIAYFCICGVLELLLPQGRNLFGIRKLRLISKLHSGASTLCNCGNSSQSADNKRRGRRVRSTRASGFWERLLCLVGRHGCSCSTETTTEHLAMAYNNY